jgi:hypothetical protein
MMRVTYDYPKNLQGIPAGLAWYSDENPVDTSRRKQGSGMIEYCAVAMETGDSSSRLAEHLPARFRLKQWGGDEQIVPTEWRWSGFDSSGDVPVAEFGYSGEVGELLLESDYQAIATRVVQDNRGAFQVNTAEREPKRLFIVPTGEYIVKAASCLVVDNQFEQRVRVANGQRTNCIVSMNPRISRLSVSVVDGGGCVTRDFFLHVKKGGVAAIASPSRSGPLEYDCDVGSYSLALYGLCGVLIGEQDAVVQAGKPTDVVMHWR